MNQLLLIVVSLFGGAFIGDLRRNRDSHTKAVQVDANILARLQSVESWQHDHNTIHGCVREIRATMDAMNKQVDRLTRRIDAWMSALPPPRVPRSPYAFDGAKEWLETDEENTRR